MKQYTTNAIILKRVNFGEADRILTVLTADSGMQSLLAKAVRRSKSKLAGGLEIFSESQVTYIEGKGVLKTIINARLQRHFGHIAEDVHKTMLAYDFMKYTYDYAQHDTENGWYTLLLQGLEGLDDERQSVSCVVIWFYSQQYRLHGAALNLEKPLNATKFSNESNYEFSFDDMSFFEKEQGSFTANHIKLLLLATSVDSPKQLSRVHDAELLSEKLEKLFQNLNKLNTT